MVYAETHTPTTNVNGLITIAIGTGAVVSGTFSAIVWSAGPYFIKTEIDPAGAAAYSITAVSELLSVPYALYAKRCANKQWAESGSSIYFNTGKVGDWEESGNRFPASFRCLLKTTGYCRSQQKYVWDYICRK